MGAADICPHKLITLVRLEHDPQVVPVREVTAGGHRQRAAKGAAPFDGVKEKPLGGVVAEVPLVITRDFLRGQLLPLHAIRRDGKTLIEQRRLEPPRRIRVARIVDGHHDWRTRLGSGNPMQSILALP